MPWGSCREDRSWAESGLMKWEYKTLKIEPEKKFWSWGGDLDSEGVDSQLNLMGQQGWELVSAFDTNSSTHGATRFVVLIFKRPV